MKAVIQRVKHAKVSYEKTESLIEQGIVVFVGIDADDTQDKIPILFNKLLNLRIFPENDKPIFKSVSDIKGSIMLISNFTLSGSIKNGRRPDFSSAMPVEQARSFFTKLENYFIQNYTATVTGKFQAMMDVELINDGPVTLLYDL